AGCKLFFLANDVRPGIQWWSRTGSNRRPPACKAGALPAELRPLLDEGTMVGLDRLELSTSPLSGVRSNHLSYRPKTRAPDGPRNETKSRSRPAAAARAAPSRSARPMAGTARERNDCHSRRKRNEGGRCRLVCATRRLSISHLCSK